MYKSTKFTEKFSTCFRQWKASGTHCKFLHGYDIYFKFTFRTELLDERNWVQDFGFLTRSEFKFDGLQLKDWFKFMFDHTTIISSTDPYIELFKGLDDEKLIQLRVMEQVGCEKFAEFVYNVISLSLKHDLGHVVELESVECFENEKNSAIFVNPKFC
jgi:6-pyruvoyltetrahydropterin/6-carboxytetrahydropterin synthase